MNITIVNVDNGVTIDGESLNFNFTLDDNIWAIQWNGTTGEVEYKDNTPNLEITSFDEYLYIVDGFNSEKIRLADVEAQAQADALDSRTYVNDREDAYPSIGDQLDMMYHDAIDGTTTWQDSVSAVKVQFPKS